jgi:hypothetical protein
MGCILLRGVHVNECKQYMFFLHSQLLYFLIVFFSQHVSAYMGHPQGSTKTVISVDRLRSSTLITVLVLT